MPSQIRLFLTVAPAMREHGRKRGRVKIGPASEAKSNAGFVAGQVDIGLVERADGADVLPVPVEEVGLDAVVGESSAARARGRNRWRCLTRSRSTRSERLNR